MIFVLLPVFNEEKNVRHVVEECKSALQALKLEYLIVAVDDGSTDATSEILMDLKSRIPLEVIAFANNQGVQEVFRQGIEEICKLGQKDDILISMDCDSTHSARVFGALIGTIQAGSDIAIASRYHRMSTCVNLPFLRALLSDGVNLILRICFHVKGARDYTTFFRAYRIGILKKALLKFKQGFIRQKGFSCMAEILIKLNTPQLRLEEVPLDLRLDLRKGKSKMKVFQTIWGYLSLIIFLRVKKN